MKLINNGNTCYINTILQFLLQSRSFANDLNKINIPKNTLLYELRNIRLIKEKKDIINPIKFINTLENKLNENLNHQYDAQEILIKIIDEFEKENKTITNKYFHGEKRNTLTCTNCKNKRINFENFTCIQLYNLVGSISKSINDYFKSEQINSVFCEKCNKNTKTIKKMKIINFPMFLIFQFMRYNTVNEIIPSNKLCFYKENTYGLKCIINHYGNLNSGHYTFLCQRKGELIEISDTDISNVSKICPRAIYLVLYSSIK